jgi:Tfp pilus assembly protein PilF
LAVSATGIALAVIVGQAIAVYADRKLHTSQAAVARGDEKKAIDAADAARRVEPWAASAYLQLALVSEQFGDVRAARRWIEKATGHDDSDWSLWLVRARLETKDGAIAEARRSLARARALNPLSLPKASG